MDRDYHLPSPLSIDDSEAWHMIYRRCSVLVGEVGIDTSRWLWGSLGRRGRSTPLPARAALCTPIRRSRWALVLARADAARNNAKPALLSILVYFTCRISHAPTLLRDLRVNSMGLDRHSVAFP
jgi:hypothetical protein